MKGILLLFVLIFQSINIVNANIYQCKDEKGKVIFKDSQCNSSENFIKEYDLPSNKANSSISALNLDSSLKVIYQGDFSGSKTRFVKVSIFEEADEYLILEVVGYFDGKPEGKLQFRAVPNINWSYSGDVSATENGFVKAYTRISLNAKAKETEKSDIFSLQLWHYSPENKASRLNILSVPFKKKWHKKRP